MPLVATNPQCRGFQNEVPERVHARAVLAARECLGDHLVIHQFAGSAGCKSPLQAAPSLAISADATLWASLLAAAETNSTAPKPASEVHAAPRPRSDTGVSVGDKSGAWGRLAASSRLDAIRVAASSNVALEAAAGRGAAGGLSGLGDSVAYFGGGSPRSIAAESERNGRVPPFSERCRSD